MDQISAMENLSPHKKFEGPPTIKPIFRPFYIYKWPKDLPSELGALFTNSTNSGFPN
jgi:hypothetical protein